MPELRIAFLILAHSDAPHLERLCHALQPHAVFVHVDGKATAFPFEKILALPNVTRVQPSIKVHWGDYSMIEATLRLIETARSAGPFDRYVLLSGACYPAKPLSALEAAFAQEPRREWINLTPIEPNSHLSHLIGRRWRMAPLLPQKSLDGKLRAIWNKVTKAMGRDLAREIQRTPYFGSQWWALTDGCVAMILDFVKAHPAFVQAYRSVYAPDEHFFQTIVGNSSFGEFATHIEERGSATNQVMPLHLIATAEDRCFTSGQDEFARVAETDRFFIRKVSTDRTAPLLDRIDDELLRAKPLVQPQ
jgi:hypothetical protein